MNKKIMIISGIVIAIAILLVVLLIPKGDKVDTTPTEPVVTEPLPVIDYYEDAALVDGVNTSTAPSNKIKMVEGKVVYTDGTEKSWLHLYKEEESLDLEKKSFYFKDGTTLVSAFNGNDTVSAIVLPDGITNLEGSFNNNFIPCDITLPNSLDSYVDTFEKAQGVNFLSNEGGKIVVIDGALYTDFGETLLLYPSWKKEEEFVLPEKVKTIGTESIIDNPYLKKIVLNEGLENIEMRGIASCAYMSEINLPSTLKKITSSFTRMLTLQALNIPKDCELAGLNFTQCPQLTLSVDAANPYYICENGVLYTKDKTILIRYLETKEDAEYNLPETVVEIGASAFAFNKHLETLTINEGVTSVGTFFADCSALTTINLPESLTSIKTMTFTRLPKLSTINYAGTIDQWLYVDKGIDWIISSIEYRLNCSDESIGYKGTA